LLLAFLALVAIAAIRIRNLFAATMLMGIYSLTAAALYVLLDAVDVALTEAAVGAGISIILMLGALVLTTHEEKLHNCRHSLLGLIVVLITGAALIYGTLDMPRFADPNAPAHLHVAPRYTQESVAEIGIPNMVASVLASYRGLDTLGETLVIFVAGVGVLLILGAGACRPRAPTSRTSSGHTPTSATPTGQTGHTPTNTGAEHNSPRSPERSCRNPGNPPIVFRVGAKLLIPVILLFALYIQFHGEYSPGGGFQAGIIFGSALILYALIYGLTAVQRAVPPLAVHLLSAVGALLFTAVGIWALFAGGHFLEYKVLTAHAHTGETIGIILVELGVGITVAAVVITLFYAFAGRAQRTHRNEG